MANSEEQKREQRQEKERTVAAAERRGRVYSYGFGGLLAGALIFVVTSTSDGGGDSGPQSGTSSAVKIPAQRVADLEPATKEQVP